MLPLTLNKLSAGLLASLVLVNAASGQTRLRHKPDAKLAARINAYIRPFDASNNFPGSILVAKGDAIVYSKGWGSANSELAVPNSPHTRFHLASITKMFTAAAILVLEEEGKLSTTDPVDKFIRGYPNGDKIRLEHLLTHSAGIPNVEFSEGEIRTHRTTEQLVAAFRDKPLDFEPGSRVRYSNSNYNLLAYIVEKVSSQSYSDFLRTKIFERLDLKDIQNDDDAALLIPNRASGTIPDGFNMVKNAPWVEWSNKEGSGSLVATAEDLAQFISAEFARGLLKPESLAKVMQKRPGFPYGWAQGEAFGRKNLWVGGRSPGFVSAVQYYPDDRTLIVVLTNTYSSMAQDPIVDDVAAIVFGKPAKSGPVIPTKPRPGQFSGVAGRYQFPANYYAPNAVLTLVDRGDYLEGRWEHGEVNVIYPVSADECLDRMYWARIRFQRDAAGKVTGFSYKLVLDFSVRKLE